MNRLLRKEPMNIETIKNYFKRNKKTTAGYSIALVAGITSLAFPLFSTAALVFGVLASVSLCASLMSTAFSILSTKTSYPIIE